MKRVKKMKRMKRMHDEEDEDASPAPSSKKSYPSEDDDDDVFDNETFLSPNKKGKRKRSPKRKLSPNDSKNHYPTTRQPPADRGWELIGSHMTWSETQDVLRSHSKEFAPASGAWLSENR